VIHLENVPDGYPGPVMLPPEKIADYQRVERLVLVGENWMGPQYTSHKALVITLEHGEEVYALDTVENRLLIGMHRPEIEEGKW
jgi:hypothetical protein